MVEVEPKGMPVESLQIAVEEAAGLALQNSGY
jgi:hypothetical protein